MKVDEVIREAARLCRSFQAKEVILYGSRSKGTAVVLQWKTSAKTKTVVDNLQKS